MRCVALKGKKLACEPMQMYKKGFYLTMAWFHRVFMRPDEVQAQHSYESS